MKTLTVLTLLAATLPLAAQQPVRPKVLGVAHMAVYVKDLPKARKFYEQFLGFAEPFTLPKKGGDAGVRIVFPRSTITNISKSSTRRIAAKASSTTSRFIPITPTRCTRI